MSDFNDVVNFLNKYNSKQFLCFELLISLLDLYLNYFYYQIIDEKTFNDNKNAIINFSNVFIGVNNIDELISWLSRYFHNVWKIDINYIENYFPKYYENKINNYSDFLNLKKITRIKPQIIFLLRHLLVIWKNLEFHKNPDFKKIEYSLHILKCEFSTNSETEAIDNVFKMFF